MKKFLPSRRKEPVKASNQDATIEDRPASSSTLAKEVENVAADVSPAAPTEGVIEPAAATPPADDAIEYVKGWKLWSMLISIASVFILVLLDMSIIATVSIVYAILLTSTNERRPSHKSHLTSIHSVMLAGTEAHISSLVQRYSH